MKIAYLASRYPSISHTFIAREVQALRNQGFEVHTFTVRRVPQTELLSQADRSEDAQTYAVLPVGFATLVGAHLAMLLLHPVSYIAAAWAAVSKRPPGVRAALWQLFYFAEAGILARQLSKRQIHHIHAHFANVAASVACLAARMMRGRWSLTLHGYADFGHPSRIALTPKIEDASLVVCVSDHGRTQAMMHSNPASWAKIVRVYCGINPEEFAPRKSDRTLAVNHPVQLLTVGRLSPEKGQSLLLRAIGALRASGTPLQCVLVGDGPERSKLEQLAVELNIASCVTFAGAVGQQDIQRYYDEADVFVLSSLYEGLPVVLMEAMAKELAVVAPHITGIPELVEQGVTGLLVRPGSENAIVEALDTLFADPASRLEMGRQGRERILQHFDNRETLQQLARYLADGLSDCENESAHVDCSPEYTCSRT